MSQHLSVETTRASVHTLFVHYSVPTAAADRFALIIDGLCKAIAASGARRVGGGPLTILIWTRLRRISARFVALAARVHAGTLPSRRGSRRAAGSPGQVASQNRQPTSRVHHNGPRLPRHFGWLLPFAPEVAAYRSQLKHLLPDPEMATLLSAAPQMQRLLRPLCWMLRIRFPKELLPPPAADAAPRAHNQTEANAKPSAAQAPLPGPTRTSGAPAFTPPAQKPA